ncbi:hypothetical protein FK535_25205 [Mycolicibacterium sp. 018/SC-01/001]|uniref:hypothetical protein n=1 Tax=Mycolicibacterium sp. 018/SC-01/001 TaxID=2592069 RepID=UPI00117FCBA7|nr:hypothetical protein [Mycolicibacterium sp. 018/SC-01/001]TRW78388.1 hypothetical protein FK535_25205 [Mycolicibacterium sp. 018/SC-01/001]
MISALAVDVLAQNPPQQNGPDFGKASPFGLIVIVVLLIAVFGLVWSMNKHLKKVPESFDTSDDQAVPGTGAPDADPDLAPGNPADPAARREPDAGT